MVEEADLGPVEPPQQLQPGLVELLLTGRHAKEVGILVGGEHGVGVRVGELRIYQPFIISFKILYIVNTITIISILN